MIKNELLEKQTFLDVYANTVLLCWKSLEEHIQDERVKRNYPTYMQFFEYLYEESKTYWQQKYPNQDLPEPT